MALLSALPFASRDQEDDVMKRFLKVVGATVAVLLMTLFSLATCNVIRVSDKGNLPSHSLGEYAVSKIEDKFEQQRVADIKNLTLTTYANPDPLISFKYPWYFAPQAKTTEAKDTEGNPAKRTLVELYTDRGIFTILIMADTYPSVILPAGTTLSKEQLSSLLLEDLRGGEFGKDEKNAELINATAASAETTRISDSPAITYKMDYVSAKQGLMCTRGAVIVSPRSLTYVIVSGLCDPAVKGYIPRSVIDETWDSFTDSLKLPQ
jgi:hypothetical protein